MVKRILLSISIMSLIISNGIAGVLVVEGNYQGKPLYIQNPFASSGVGFCTYEVTVNGDITTDETNSSAFEVDFSNFNLKIGDPVTVKIKHKDDCIPKVLNPEVLKPKSTYDISDMNIEKHGVLSWKTKNESGKLNFIIEQYRWNKWIKIGEVNGVGTPDENSYSFQLSFHSGENQFRIKQIDYTGNPRISPLKRFKNVSMEEITFAPKKVSKNIIFTGETLFEVYDSYGNIVKKGYGEKIEAMNLKKGVYYLNYDNQTEKFIKK